MGTIGVYDVAVDAVALGAISVRSPAAFLCCCVLVILNAVASGAVAVGAVRKIALAAGAVYAGTIPLLLGLLL